MYSFGNENGFGYAWEVYLVHMDCICAISKVRLHISLGLMQFSVINHRISASYNVNEMPFFKICKLSSFFFSVASFVKRIIYI